MSIKEMASAANLRGRQQVRYWLWHAQTIHVFMRIGKGGMCGAATGTGAGAGLVTIKRPETRGRQVIGDHESIDRINVLQACDLVLGIGLSDHHGDSNMSERYSGLRVEGLRRGDRGLAH